MIIKFLFLKNRCILIQICKEKEGKEEERVCEKLMKGGD